MSMLKSNMAGARIAVLAVRNEKIFHIKDLANLWGITDSHLLRITLSRYVKNELLYPIYRGFYSLTSIKDCDPLLLGAKAIHTFSYLTLESILFREGYVSKKIEDYTFVGEKNKRFSIGEFKFTCRQLNIRFLYNSEGIKQNNGVMEANAERAIADMLYFNPRYHFDRPIDWKKIQLMQKKIGYPLTLNRYDTTEG
ncbi:MAG: hypothetical protein AAB373_00900 [Patescibacteria group bacterium]